MGADPRIYADSFFGKFSIKILCKSRMLHEKGNNLSSFNSVSLHVFVTLLPAANAVTYEALFRAKAV